MNNEQRDEILKEIHTSTKVTEQVVASQGKKLESLARDYWGNGKSGTKEDVTLLKDRQRNCPARKAISIENKRLSLVMVAVAVAVISTLASIAFGIMNVAK